jgi:hypothetical protein
MQTNKIKKTPMINTIFTNPIQSLGGIRAGLFLSLLMVSQPSLAMNSEPEFANEMSEQSFFGANNSSSSIHTGSTQASNPRNIHSINPIPHHRILDEINYDLLQINIKIDESKKNKNDQKEMDLEKEKFKILSKAYHRTTIESFVYTYLMDNLDKVFLDIESQNHVKASNRCRLMKDLYVETKHPSIVHFLNAALDAIIDWCEDSCPTELSKYIQEKDDMFQELNKPIFKPLPSNFRKSMKMENRVCTRSESESTFLIEKLIDDFHSMKDCAQIESITNILINITDDENLKGDYSMQIGLVLSDVVDSYFNAKADKPIEFFVRAQKHYERAGNMDKLARLAIKSGNHDLFFSTVEEMISIEKSKNGLLEIKDQEIKEKICKKIECFFEKELSESIEHTKLSSTKNKLSNFHEYAECFLRWESERLILERLVSLTQESHYINTPLLEIQAALYEKIVDLDNHEIDKDFQKSIKTKNI